MTGGRLRRTCASSAGPSLAAQPAQWDRGRSVGPAPMLTHDAPSSLAARRADASRMRSDRRAINTHRKYCGAKRPASVSANALKGRECRRKGSDGVGPPQQGSVLCLYLTVVVTVVDRSVSESASARNSSSIDRTWMVYTAALIRFSRNTNDRALSPPRTVCHPSDDLRAV